MTSWETPLHVTSRHCSHDIPLSIFHTNTVDSIFNMAPVRRGCAPTTEQTIRRFSPDASFNPFLLLGFCFEAFCAAIQYIILLTTQTGRKLLVRDKNLSFSSEVHDCEASNPYVFRSSKSDLKRANPPIRMDDHQWNAFESGSVKMNSRRFDLQDNSDKTFGHGIQDIVSLLANCVSKNLDIAPAKKKKNNGFFPGLGRFIHFLIIGHL